MGRLILILLLLAPAALWCQIAAHLKYGTPDCSDGQILDKKYYVICYQPAWKIAKWTMYHVTRQDLRAKNAARKDDFRADPDVENGPRLKDYQGSGYDRGHSAPAGDFARSSEAMSATFLLTNMAPQKPGLNRAHWRELEMAVRAHVEDAWICTGPVEVWRRTGEGGMIGNAVKVPLSFFKTVLCKHAGKQHILTATAANEDGAGISWESLRALEKRTGLVFWGALPEHDSAGSLDESLALVADEISSQALRKFPVSTTK